LPRVKNQHLLLSSQASIACSSDVTPVSISHEHFAVSKSNSNKSLACDKHEWKAVMHHVWPEFYSTRHCQYERKPRCGLLDGSHRPTVALLSALFAASNVVLSLQSMTSARLSIERFNIQYTLLHKRLFSSPTVLKYWNNFRILLFTSSIVQFDNVRTVNFVDLAPVSTARTRLQPVSIL